MTFDNTSVLKSKLRWNSIAKPLGGLGLLEDMVSKIAGIQRTEDVSITHRTAVIMCCRQWGSFLKASASLTAELQHR